MTKLNWKSDWFIGLVITLVFLVFAEAAIFESLDSRAYDLGVSFSPGKKADDDIVVVAIDDKSIQALGAWPWSRNLLAKATRLLSKATPQVIGFTVPFDLRQGKTGQASLLDSANLIDVAVYRGFAENRIRPVEFGGDMGTEAVTNELLSLL